MRFSNRTPDDLSLNAIAQAAEGVKVAEVIDLTQSNPTHCGFNYPADLLKGLARPEALQYEPQAFGLAQAREAVAKYLQTKSRRVSPSNLILTASTSEAYSFLFKLLGNPGDSFLVPTPGYPLLDHLLQLESLEPIPYPALTQPNWPVNLKTLEQAITAQTKGLIAVNPNNPTGVCLSQGDEEAVLQLCQKHSLAYISDEVFMDYLDKPATVINKVSQVLTFRLGGLSKSLGLPQLKLSWIEIEGPEKLVTEAKTRLELIADTYLSVSTPVQVALNDLLTFAPNIQKQITDRVKANRQSLESLFKGHTKAKVWPAQGGWYALLEVLDRKNDEQLVIDLLQKHQVMVHPGGFYDFEEGCFLVISLLPQLEKFQTGARRISDYLA